MIELRKSLSFYSAFSIVVGSMIGTGVFLKSATMAQTVGSPHWVLTAWLLAGLLSLMGALTYAEMGKRYPQVGGEYVYLRESYGSLPAFLYGWTRFWIASTGSVAAYGVGAATFLSGAFSLEAVGGKTTIALIFIGLFTLTNCLAVSVGGKIQSYLTTFKILMIVSLILVLGFIAVPTANPLFQSVSQNNGFSKGAAIGMAVLSALWAFDGWNNLPMAASEVQDSSRNVPAALISGTAIVLFLYLTLNWVFFRTLTFSEIVSSNSTLHPKALPLAAKAVHHIAGNYTLVLVSVLFVISSLGAMNGSILTGARVPFAMAEDGIFFSAFKTLDPRSHVPIFAVAAQGIWAMVLAFSGTFDQLTDYVIFSSWIFYGAIGFAVFRMKGSRKLLALVFSLCALALVINTIVNAPKASLTGLGLILAGIPFYYFFETNSKKT